jgi:hypothetical protein
MKQPNPRVLMLALEIAELCAAMSEDEAIAHGKLVLVAMKGYRQSPTEWKRNPMQALASAGYPISKTPGRKQ